MGANASLGIFVTALTLLGATGCSKLNNNFPTLPNSGGSTTITNTNSVTNNLAVLQPNLAISPPVLDYGTIAVSSTATQNLTITNNGAAAASGLSLNLLGSLFSQVSTSCGSTLAIGANCTATYQFGPASNGNYGAVVTANTINGNAASSVLKVVVGTGSSGAVPTLSLNPTSLSFPTTNVGSSASLTITVSNSGTGVASGMATSVQGAGFTQSSSCTSSLAVGASCTVTVNFSPPGNGTWSGVFAVSANSTYSQVALMSGQGQGGQPAFSISPSSYAYGALPVNAYADNVFTITNVGTAATSATTLSILGSGFTVQSDACTGTLLNVSSTCQVTVRFQPTSSGNDSAFFMVSTSGANTSMAALTGSGISSGTSAGVITLSASAVSFPSTATGSSNTQTITVTNTGTAIANGIAPAVSGTAFTLQSTTCTGVLTVGAGCNLVIKFAPTAAGAYAGYLSVTSSDSGQAQATLSANGTSAGNGFTLAPPSFDFGSVLTNQTASATFVLQNAGASASGTLTVSTSSSSNFPINTNTCTGTLGAGSSCQITIGFVPSAQITYTGQISVNDGGPNSIVAGVRGQGVTPGLSVTPATFNFGNLVVGAQASQGFTVANIAATDAAGFSAAVLGSGYSISTNGCSGYSADFPAGQSCNVTVQFAPPGNGTYSGFVVAQATSRATIYGDLIGGGGTPASLSISPGTYNFGTVFTTQSPTQVYTITNSGGVTASSISFGLSDATNFSQTTSCGTSLGSGLSCTVTLTLAPTAQAAVSTTLTLNYNNGLVPESTSATASGIGRFTPVLTLNPPTYNFGELTVGNFLQQTFTLANTGTVGVPANTGSYASGLTFTTSDPINSGSFVILNNNCPTTLYGGQSCTFVVEFAPARIYDFSGANAGAITVGYNEQAPLANPALASVLDGDGGNGLAWNFQFQQQPTMTSYQLSFATAMNGYLSTPYGMVKATNDGGNTWRSLAMDSWNTLSGIVGTSTGVYALDEVYGGPDSGLHETSNGGLFWTSYSPFTDFYSYLACAPGGNFCASSGKNSSELLSTPNGGTNWSQGAVSQIPFSNGYDRSDIAIPDTNSVYLSDASPQIVGSHDGGNTFYQMVANTNQYAIAANSTTNAWVVGSGGRLRVTNNAGATWQNLQFPTFDTLLSIGCSDSTHCWIGTINGIWYTANGGSTFTEQLTGLNSVESISVINSTTAYALDLYGHVHITTNTGATWNSVATNVTGNGTGMVCRTSTDCLMTISAYLGSVYRTVNGAVSWYEVAGSNPIGQVSVAGTTAFAASAGSTVYTGGTTIGNTWQPVAGPPGESFLSTFWVSSTTGWVGTTNGQIWNTTNGGTSWTKQFTVVNNYTINRIFFVNSTTGWAVGTAGTIVATTNGGTTWTAQTDPTTNSLTGLHFIDANNGWAVGGTGLGNSVVYTTNGGATWTVGTVIVPGGATMTLYSVYFTSATTGFATGTYSYYNGTQHYDCLFTSNNGGLTWTVAQLSGITGTANYGTGYGIYFDSTNTNGYIVGPNGAGNLMYKTGNGGLSWIALAGPTVYPYSSSPTPNSSQSFNDVVVDVGGNVFVTTTAGAILESSNGGTSWTQVNVGYFGYTTSVTYSPANNGYAWVSLSGYSNTALTIQAQDGGTVWKGLVTGPDSPAVITAFDNNNLILSSSYPTDT